MVLGDAVTENYRRLYGSLTLIQEYHNLIPVQLYLEHQTWSRANLNMTFYVVVSVYRLV